MFSIRNKAIDFIGDNSLFYQHINAIYQLECDSNYMIYVGHFIDRSMNSVLTDLLQSSHTNLLGIPSNLAQAINESEVLTVKILRTQGPITGMTPKGFLRIVLTQKYELIRSLKAYSPYGLNDLEYSSLYCVEPKERALAKSLIATLRGECKDYQATGEYRFKKVYQYNKATGEFIKEYSSVTEAASSLNVTHAAISNCCAGRVKTIGGYIWSYNKVDRLNVEEHLKNARVAPIGWLTPKERAELIEERTKKFMERYNTL